MAAITINIKETPEELKAALKGKSGVDRQKIEMLYLFRTGEALSLMDVHYSLQVGYSTLYRWHVSYLSGGLKNLLDYGKRAQPQGKSAQQMRPRILSLIKQVLAERTFASYIELGQWLKTSRKIKVADSTLLNYCRQLKLAHRILSTREAKLNLEQQITPAPRLTLTHPN